MRLETGRTHQIRLHLDHAGYPILGDKLYGMAQRQWTPGPRRDFRPRFGEKPSPFDALKGLKS